MKRIIILIFLVIFSLTCGFAFAKSKKSEMPSIKFNGTPFHLYYSVKNKEYGGYINEYYKQNQTYTNWNELLAVHHYANAFYPIKHAESFSDFLSSSGAECYLTIDEEDNSAILDFVISDNRKLPIIVEYDVFKYEKSHACGTVALQYARRYMLSNSLQVNDIKKMIKKNRKKYIKSVKRTKIPDIVNVKADKGKYVNTEAVNEEEEGFE